VPQTRQPTHPGIDAPETDRWVGEDEEWLRQAESVPGGSEEEWAAELDRTRTFLRTLFASVALGLAIWSLVAFAVYWLVVG
jgi:hypothetical protein